MKKFCAAMTSCMLVMTMSASVFAADNNVWIDESELNVNHSEVVANIYSDGTNTDGLLVITYNADELAVSENDVVVGENIEMYSANVVEEGTLKIAYLAKETTSEDVLFTLNFDSTATTLSKDAISISGNVYNEKGNELTVGIKNIENTPTKPGDSTNTGDNNHIVLYLGAGVIALAFIIGISLYSKKSKKKD